MSSGRYTGPGSTREVDREVLAWPLERRNSRELGRAYTRGPLWPGESEWRVTWEIDVVAAGPTDAAKAAAHHARKRDTTATVYTVRHADGRAFEVDLLMGMPSVRVLQAGPTWVPPAELPQMSALDADEGEG